MRVEGVIYEAKIAILMEEVRCNRADGRGEKQNGIWKKQNVKWKKQNVKWNM
jgi:hypothetical protein